MRADLLDILVCPVCRASLELRDAEESGDEIIAGALVCTGCGERYPIQDGIPNLLPPDLRDE